MESIRLYTQWRNPFSEKVARGLRLKRLAFDRVISEDPADWRRWSPITGQLPVLEIDGARRQESNEILRWLDELHPDPPLLSTDPKVAEAQRQLAAWSDSSFLYYWNSWRATRAEDLWTDENRPEPALLERLRSTLSRGLGRSDPNEEREDQVIDAIARRLDDIEGLLGQRRFFYSDEPSIADLSVIGMLTVLRDGPIPRTATLLRERPTLMKYMERMEARLQSDPDPSDTA